MVSKRKLVGAAFNRVNLIYSSLQISRESYPSILINKKKTKDTKWLRWGEKGNSRQRETLKKTEETAIEAKNFKAIKYDPKEKGKCHIQEIFKNHKVIPKP